METLLAVLVMGGCFVLLGLGVMLARGKVCLRGSCGGDEKESESSCSCKSSE